MCMNRMNERVSPFVLLISVCCCPVSPCPRSSFSYRKLALKYHPLKNGNDEGAAAQFRLVAEAYDVLADRKEKRDTLVGRGVDQCVVARLVGSI